MMWGIEERERDRGEIKLEFYRAVNFITNQHPLYGIILLRK